MENCRYCGTECPEQGEHDRFFSCALYTDRKPTNADRIRGMSNGALARFLTHTVADGCPPDMDGECQKDKDGWDGCEKCWERWLAQPAQEE